MTKVYIDFIKQKNGFKSFWKDLSSYNVASWGDKYNR